MQKDLPRLLSGIQAIAGVAAIGAILVWAPVCSGMLELSNGNMTHMRCYYTGQAALLLSIILIVSGIEAFIAGSARPWTSIVTGILMISVTFASPLGIGVCMKVMACHSTAFWIRGCGAAAIACGVAAMFMGKRRV